MNRQSLRKSHFAEIHPQQYAPKNRVDIKPLKKLVFEKFPKDCALRSALLAERDVLEIYEFLAKMETFLNLLKVI